MKATIIFVSALFILMGCNTKQTPTDKTITQEQQKEIGKLNEFLEYYDGFAVKFTFPADKPIQIEGTSGILIDVNPDDLLTVSGNKMGKTIELELKVLTNQEHLLKANAQTVSDGRLLVSGGAYYIGLKSNGEELKLKDGRTLSVAFPKVSDEVMQLFYGERGQLGELNWKKTDQSFESNESIENVPAPQQPAAPTEGSEGYEDYHHKIQKNPIYQAIQLSKLGWINCDRFYDIQHKTDLLFAFNPADSITSARVFLVFKDINSVMDEHYWHKEDQHSFKNVPEGAKVSLIAVSLRKNKIYSSKTDLTIEKQKPIEIALQETSIEQLGNLFHVK